MNAIIYESNAGHTQRLAAAVGQKLGLPVYTLKEAKRNKIKGDGILYFGWIMGGKIVGIDKLSRLCRPAGVIGVGMSTPSDELKEKLRESNLLGKVPFIYIQGGFQLEKLRGIYRLMIRTALKQAEKEGEPADFTEEERSMRRMLQNGCDLINDDSRNIVCGFVQAIEEGKSDSTNDASNAAKAEKMRKNP